MLCIFLNNDHIFKRIGDRTARIHVGFNQTLYVAHGQFPSDLAVYRGGEATMQGELQVIGVTVSNEGRLRNMENITIVDGGNVIDG